MEIVDWKSSKFVLDNWLLSTVLHYIVLNMLLYLVWYFPEFCSLLLFVLLYNELHSIGKFDARCVVCVTFCWLCCAIMVVVLDSLCHCIELSYASFSALKWAKIWSTFWSYWGLLGTALNYPIIWVWVSYWIPHWILVLYHNWPLLDFCCLLVGSLGYRIELSYVPY